MLICSAGAAAQPTAETASVFPARTLWTIPLSSSLSALPGFLDSKGYFPLQNDRLEAYDLTEARRLWVASVRPQSRPAAGDGLVFVADRDAVVALRDEDGALAWRLPITERLAVPLVWDNGWLITVSESGTVSAFRATDGYRIWQRDIGSPASAPPALAADRVYIPAEDGRLIALQVESGAVIWTRPLGGTPHDVLALDERLYLGTADKFFYCVRASDGRVDWRWRTGGDVIGLPVIDDRRVYFVSLDNLLRGLDRNGGTQRWISPLPLRPNTGPVRVADALIVSGVSPMLRAYAARTGESAGAAEAPGDLAAPPHVVDADGLQTIVIVTRDIAKGAQISGLGRRPDSP